MRLPAVALYSGITQTAVTDTVSLVRPLVSPERLMSVRESLVVVPAAVKRLTDWSLIWLQ